MVWYTSLIATPCLSTLSRSTLMYSSGTLGINVEVTKPISGRLRAAARNLFRLNFRTLARGCQEFVQIIAKKLDIFSGAIFQDELKSAGRANTGNRRR